ncbi:aromatic ring-hydroxylating dioxygenase subunit alpha [Novosphingobium album (ex Hu et al. 2023)]|uniref:Aromatic ring-hydroxylating dioxygenase subunit alpha n=1 Tax=Novosphingobium album (ex Hu et al. 2023) TaxID=2930093 RepID=A0ABT0B6W4_9SPHN|nr:aromatic ring-hydroxylating dioxygenase subunit alpha [Novosphingobium album (ex Hu et al. 2023)]MCJ2180743.1 aromatic ring-hydroxylating dioxygenase subunit alpha [Novosphingobium album (ex Hu et al. 2023)]
MPQFLRNAWYCVAWLQELGEEPFGLQVLGEHVAVYRDSCGEWHALDGRCPHRFASLAQGRVIGDALMCPYHGLQFGPDGRCVLNPVDPEGQAPDVVIRHYPVRIRNGGVWIWMGDPALADEASLPPESAAFQPGYAAALLYFKVNANYQLVIDNLLDLTHAAFLHGETLAAAGDVPKHDFSMQGNVIHSDYRIEQGGVMPIAATLFDDDLCETLATMRWRPASNLDLDVRLHPLEGSNAQPLHMPSVHYLTPESENVTHYFAAIARNRKLDDPAEQKRMHDMALKAFTQEDEPMVNTCQSMMGTADLMAMKPVILKTDVAAVQARRVIAKLVKRELREEAA